MNIRPLALTFLTLAAACSGESDSTDAADQTGGSSSTGGESASGSAPMMGETDPDSSGGSTGGSLDGGGGTPMTGDGSGGETTGGSGGDGTGGDGDDPGGETGGSSSDGTGLGHPCDSNEECDSGMCDDGVCLTTAPGCLVEDVERSPGDNWSDSYSVDGKCYCATTFDHAIGDIMVETPVGMRSVKDICDALGDGPGIEGNPVYNDVQCGNGPANDAGDEDWCPGRVDQSDGGCCTVGPKWDLSVLSQ